MGESERRLAELHAHNEKRNALFRNPNDENMPPFGELVDVPAQVEA